MEAGVPGYPGLPALTHVEQGVRCVIDDVTLLFRSLVVNIARALLLIIVSARKHPVSFGINSGPDLASRGAMIGIRG